MRAGSRCQRQTPLDNAMIAQRRHNARLQERAACGASLCKPLLALGSFAAHLLEDANEVFDLRRPLHFERRVACHVGLQFERARGRE